MKNCPHCGAKIDGTAFFCPNCGRPLEIKAVKPEYDHYYDDVRPEDADIQSKRKGNSGVALRVGLILFGLALTIATCIAVLCLI